MPIFQKKGNIRQIQRFFGLSFPPEALYNYLPLGEYRHLVFSSVENSRFGRYCVAWLRVQPKYMHFFTIFGVVQYAEGK
jgi:hypothetical protein